MAELPTADLTTLHVRRATTGDVESKTFLVERFTPLLLAQARYRLPGGMRARCEPEDLVQEVWAIALPRLHDLEPREGRWTPVLVKFLATTLLRCANHALRKRVAQATGDSTTAGLADQLPAQCSGVITRLARQQQINALQAAIDELPPEEREILVLRGIEQHKNSDIAAQLGVDNATVTRRWQRALQTLRTRLQASVLDELE